MLTHRNHIVKKTAKKHEQKDTKTKQIYEELLKEMEQKQKESLHMSHKCHKEDEEFETTKPQRNIFKMSRVLVDKKDKKTKNKGTSKSA